MNCNKKSHFDGVTPVHGQEGGRVVVVVAGGAVDLVMSLFARRRCSLRALEEGKW